MIHRVMCLVFSNLCVERCQSFRQNTECNQTPLAIFNWLLSYGPTNLNGSKSFDTYMYTDMLLPPGLVEVFLSDVDDPPIAKPAPPCSFTQSKLDDDLHVEKAKQAAVIRKLNVIDLCLITLQFTLGYLHVYLHIHTCTHVQVQAFSVFKIRCYNHVHVHVHVHVYTCTTFMCSLCYM